ncbi:hypothetical protein, partial [Hyphococcus luteus]|uniref:hypothetical protein n=1 Tax=Hyphococcus luteus TaxID=2058213 RepID=UPI001A9C3B96
SASLIGGSSQAPNLVFRGFVFTWVTLLSAVCSLRKMKSGCMHVPDWFVESLALSRAYYKAQQT